MCLSCGVYMYQWGFTGLAINYFSEQQFYCTPAEIIALPLSDGSFYSVHQQLHMHMDT